MKTQKGNTKLIILIVIAIVVAGAFIAFNIQSKSTIQLGQPQNIITPSFTSDETVNSLPTTGTGEDTTMQKSSGSYVEFSKQAFEAAKDKKRVYFFHANWCPTCKAANETFTISPNAIPADVVVFKTDYDTQTELKKKYGITYQHTFVQVDPAGNELAKWNGGDLDLLRQNIK